MCMAKTGVPVSTVYICSVYVYFVAIFGMSLDNFDTCLNKKDLLYMYKMYKVKEFEFCALHSKPYIRVFIATENVCANKKKKNEH